MFCLTQSRIQKALPEGSNPEGRKDPNSTKSGASSAIESWLGSFVIFQGIRTSIAKKPYIFVIFFGEGGPDPLSPPPLWICTCNLENIFSKCLTFYICPTNYHMRLYRPQINVCSRKLYYLFLNKNKCCGYSKEQPHCDSSFEHPQSMFKLMGNKIIAILCLKNLLIWPYMLLLITLACSIRLIRLITL